MRRMFELIYTAGACFGLLWLEHHFPGLIPAECKFPLFFLLVLFPQLIWLSFQATETVCLIRMYRRELRQMKRERPLTAWKKPGRLPLCQCNIRITLNRMGACSVRAGPFPA